MGKSTEGRYIGDGRDTSAPTDTQSIVLICIILIPGLVGNTFQIRGKESKSRQKGSLSDIL
jgi:hypothetical protein